MISCQTFQSLLDGFIVTCLYNGLLYFNVNTKVYYNTLGYLKYIFIENYLIWIFIFAQNNRSGYFKLFGLTFESSSTCTDAQTVPSIILLFFNVPVQSVVYVFKKKKKWIFGPEKKSK